jgi:HSP20 family protein
MAVIIRRPLMLDEAFAGWPFAPELQGTVTSQWFPPSDVVEDKDGIKIVVELPGVQRDDVKLSLENNILTIRGEKKPVAEQVADKVHRYERTYGTFERVFSLPNTVDADRVQATFENGVLTVILPKLERARLREIPVKINAA